jgi:hypothetical protein
MTSDAGRPLQQDVIAEESPAGNCREREFYANERIGLRKLNPAEAVSQSKVPTASPQAR